MECAGSFVVEALDGHRSVYRLYHQALAEYLRHGREKEEMQRLIVVAPMETVPSPGRRWQQKRLAGVPSLYPRPPKRAMLRRVACWLT
jgi:hypothetical protein